MTMNTSESLIVRLRLTDAGQISQSGLVLPEHRSVGHLRLFLQKLQQVCDRNVFLVCRSAVTQQEREAGQADINGQGDGQAASQAERIAGLAGLQVIDEQSRRYRLHLFCGSDGPDSQLLRSIVQYAMNEENCFRLELEIGSSEKHWLPLLQSAGWKEEGCLQSTRYHVETSLHEDVYLYALIRPRQAYVSVAFFPFSKAVLAIVGDDQGLQSTQFVRYGERTDDVRIQESAEWFNLLDSQGRLPDRQTVMAHFAGRSWLCAADAPDVLQAAARQINDYFHGLRKQFDVPLHLEQGSPFQQKVWRALADIPFGVTRTYEDIACTISQENTIEARKMARAVGSACGANPLPLILPCHRVIGKNGRLVGFSGGLDIKEYLLAHEIMGLA
jgi:O-6-methylguanine DNA methyltransferase